MPSSVLNAPKVKEFFFILCLLLRHCLLQDNGKEFYYTGSGGRDLSGNKRTAEQSCDQQLTRMNRYNWLS